MDDVIEELLKIVVESLQSEEGNLNKAVDLAINFSTKNSISASLLLGLSNSYGSKGSYELAYIFAKAAASLSIGSEKAVAHHNAGLAADYLNLVTEAEEQYKFALETDPKHIAAHSNYGRLLKQMGRLEEAEEQYKLALETKRALETDPKHVVIHSNYGNLLEEMGRLEEAEEQYKLALKIDPNYAAAHYNYGILLSEIEHWKEAEYHYKLALKLNPKHVDTHLNYGNLLQKMDRLGEAEEQYKLALEADPKHVNTHLSYGVLLQEMRHLEEAEEQCRLALEADPKNVNAHYNYGILLADMERLEEAEEQYKVAIKLDPKEPNIHGAYGLLLLSKNLESIEAINETKIASHLFEERGDRIKEHLSFAWFYEELANKYYNLRDYQKSGKYADKSGDEYIEAGKQAGESFKGTSLTKGYTLKGRAKIRTLEIKTPFYKNIIKRIWNKESYEIEKFTKIIDCIMDASRCYEKAANVSPKDNQLCDACSFSMFCLSDMLDYMLAVTKQEKTPQLEDKLENWNEKLSIAKNAYKEHSKGELFIESLYKLKDCIQNLNKYRKHGTREYGRAFEECRKELTEIANNIEGPLQKIIEDATKKMDICCLKQLPYTGTETGSILQPSKLSEFLNWTLDPKRIGIGVFGIIITVIVNHYNEYLFSLIKRTVTMLLSKIQSILICF
ncbi:tetratricopeptide repeat protein [Methanosarcina vacuolata]|uniref:Uncharacterized protein n=1 Tax=Methanosarcina vacuolata Z-761 TaxID=1434123 RepID=A0A0E3Q733_9EURY|nr:tetratricopeptide repeat protein [Methanosarcina vacuolata]AKB44694.1 hypothetical protein MSVAZ_2425 [Methanosarcina vacuolata Z-761]